MGSLAKGFLWKVCGNFCGKFAEICKNTFYCVRKGCGNSAESLRKFCGNLQNIPDPPTLAFFDFLAFFLFSCFEAFFLCFPRILGVPRQEKPLLFSRFPLFLSKQQGKGGSGFWRFLPKVAFGVLVSHYLSGPISRDIAILSLRYPVLRDTFSGRLALPPNGAIPPPWHLVSHKHICAIPHFATYRAIIVRYPTKTSTREFCDTIATSIARYEKYRCWASKPTMARLAALFVRRSLQRNRLQRQAFSVIHPLLGLSLDCGRPFLLRKDPVSPYSLNLGGAISPLKFWGWSVRNPLFYSVFWGPPPKFWGVKLSPPKFRGYVQRQAFSTHC